MGTRRWRSGVVFVLLLGSLPLPGCCLDRDLLPKLAEGVVQLHCERLGCFHVAHHHRKGQTNVQGTKPNGSEPPVDLADLDVLPHQLQSLIDFAVADELVRNNLCTGKGEYVVMPV